ncbi:MAG: phospholipase D-like domain-containing protein [Nocardioides sp.]|nr:phospholipase D-like domain-containing protein [Nocardioides sp.]
MRKSTLRLLPTSLVTALVAGLLAVAGSVPASAAPTPDTYVPPSGPVFNNPYGTKEAVRRLIRQVNRTIDSVPPKGKIRISAWNVRSYHMTSALLRAHKRGVSVRVIMDRHNWNPDNPNADAQRLARGLRVGNKRRSTSRKSWLKRCRRSCRGTAGIPHTKLFLFDRIRGKRNGKSYPVRWVSMYGSYNATELGATIQWNDIYTFKNDQQRYQFFNNVFKQMAVDEPRRQGYLTYGTGSRDINQIYPYKGAGTAVDPVMEALNSVRCTGAATSNGRTRIRIAQTSMYGDRGLAIANKLAQLRRQGCGIRLVYAMFGNKVLKVLRDANVPLTHLAYDSNEDGIYDRYVHMKSMAISGNVAGKPDAKITWNGSANWTSVALASDEVLGTIIRPRVTTKYMKWIDYMFTHRPAYWGPQHPDNQGRVAHGSTEPMTQEAYASMVEKRAKERGVDPYALIKQEN